MMYFPQSPQKKNNSPNHEQKCSHPYTSQLLLLGQFTITIIVLFLNGIQTIDAFSSSGIIIQTNRYAVVPTFTSSTSASLLPNTHSSSIHYYSPIIQSRVVLSMIHTTTTTTHDILYPTSSSTRSRTSLYLQQKQYPHVSFIRSVRRHSSNIHDWMDGDENDEISNGNENDNNSKNNMDGSKKNNEDPNDPQKTNSYDMGFAQFLSVQEQQQQRLKEEEEVKSAAESLKRFLSGGSGGGGSSSGSSENNVKDNKSRSSNDGASSKMIQPISLDGTRMEVGNGESKAEINDARGRKVVKTNFDNLFQGMPGLNNLLEPSSTSMQATATGGGDEEINTNPDANEDDDQAGNEKYLSNQDIKDVDSKLDSFKDGMREKLNQMKDDENNSIPDNAEQILDHVVKEQRKYDLKELSDLRAVESFDEYEAARRLEWEESVSSRVNESVDGDDGDVAVVREIMEEAQEINDWKESQEEELKNFRMYEESLKKQHAQQSKADSSASTSKTTTAMGYDELQLKLMSDLLEKRQSAAAENGFEDEDLYLTDNIEDGIEELEAKIAKQQRKPNTDSTGPQDLKEWQMYRAIATRLAEQRGINLGQDDITNEEDADVINTQLKAWKDFVEKEKDMRDKAGLSIKVRMPFEWSDKPDDYTASSRLPPRQVDREKSEQAKTELDDLALKVISDLMEKTENPERREKLRRELMELQEQIETRNENLKRQAQEPTEEFQKEVVKPMDISSILKSKSKPQRTISRQQNRDEVKPPLMDEIPISRSINNQENEVYELTDNDIDEPPIVQPDSPFFQEDEEFSPDATPAVQPNSPFFHDEEIYEDENYQDYSNTNKEEYIGPGEVTPSLGSQEEQKFRSLVARSGVRTVEEQEELRRKWEEYQQAEQNMRDMTGLSGKLDSNKDIVEPAEISPQQSPFLSKDTDAPTSSSQGDTRSSYEEFQKYEQQMKQEMLDQQNKISEGNAVIDEEVHDNEANDVEEEQVIIHQKRATQWQASTYADQMYRSVGASNLSKNLDDEEKENSKAAFGEFLEQEEQIRQKFQDIADNSEGVSNNDIDIEEYADQVLSTLKPRPKIQKKSKPNQEDILGSNINDTKRGTVKEEKRGSNLSDSLKKTSNADSSVLQEQMPDWLRREIEEVRGEEFQLSDDDYEKEEFYTDFDTDEDYAEKERQAQEFEQKFSNAPKEISIGDMLGRDYFGADDYDDYDQRRESRFSTFSSFEARKKNILEYTVLSVAELNALMEHKVSTLEVSPYLKKINKPYSEFGALFRLEGILVDVSGLHYEAWKKTASMYNFSAPSFEDIKLASVHDAEFVVRRILYWTDDIFMCRKVAKTFKEVALELFHEWEEKNPLSKGDASSQDISSYEDSSGGFIDAPTQQVSIDQRDVLDLHHTVWCKIADNYGFEAPSKDLVEFGFTLSPDQVVMRLFRWSEDEALQSKLAMDFRESLKKETLLWASRQNVDFSSFQKSSEGYPKEEVAREPILSDSDLNDIQMYGWTAAAEKYNYEPPSIELVELAAWVSPEKAVMEVFRWTSDEEEINNVVEAFRGARRNRSSMYVERLPSNFQQTVKQNYEKKEVKVKNTGPSEQDVMDLQLRAWEKASKQFNLASPEIDQVAAAAFVGPDKAVTSIFKWTDSNDEAASIVASFRSELKELSREWTSTMNRTITDRASTLEEQEDNLPMFALKDGVLDWLETLQDLEVPCAVLSYMSEDIVSYILKSTSLNKYFTPEKIVSYSNGYGSEMQQMLGGALRVERRPDHCIVFDCIPQAAAYAHDVEMKNVAIVSPYPYYELTSSDLTSRDLDTISTINLKNIFSEYNADGPMEQLQVEGPQIKIQRQTKTRFWEDGDR